MPVFLIDVVMRLHKQEGVIFSTAGGSRCRGTTTNYVNNASSLADVYLHPHVHIHIEQMNGGLRIRSSYKYYKAAIIRLFIVDVDVKWPLLCSGGHAVLLRAALPGTVIKDVLDDKLLQHGNNCLLASGIWNLSTGIWRVNRTRK